LTIYSRFKVCLVVLESYRPSFCLVVKSRGTKGGGSIYSVE
jgi:hypothetical protein